MPYVFALGDYNANMQSESVFGPELIGFCDLNNLCFIDKSSLTLLSAKPIFLLFFLTFYMAVLALTLHCYRYIS